jgi:hypothetical protein
MMKTVLTLMIFGLCALLAGCDPRWPTSFGVHCENGIATHDFGTTNPGELAKVTASAFGPNCMQQALPDPSGPEVGYAMFEVPVTFAGSVGTVSCHPGCGTKNFPRDYTWVVFTLGD